MASETTVSFISSGPGETSEWLTLRGSFADNAPTRTLVRLPAGVSSRCRSAPVTGALQVDVISGNPALVSNRDQPDAGVPQTRAIRRKSLGVDEHVM
jgi:hypothetical protein